MYYPNDFDEFIWELCQNSSLLASKLQLTLGKGTIMDLNIRLKKRKGSLFFKKILRMLTLITSILLLTFTILAIMEAKSDEEEFIGEILTIIPTMFLLFLFISVILYKLQIDINDLEIEIKDVLNEIDLEKIEIASIEARAEKMFKLHQYELEKYYKQNLRQGNQVFIIGILFMILGFIIVIISLYLIGYKETSNSNAVAILGAIGTILSNYIASIYLRMFSDTAKSATEFHNRLVSTHNLMFSNYIASKIKNEGLRERTYSNVATHLGNMKFEKEEAEAEKKGKDKTEEEK